MSHAYIAPAGAVQELAMAAVCAAAPAPCRVCAHCSKALRGIHPDVSVVESAGREIVVAEIRALRRDAIIVPNEAERKVYIVKNADSMNVSAQNALLKLLEDPPGGTVLILQTDSPAALLPTVRSRCVQLRGKPQERETGISETETAQEFFRALEGGDLALMEFALRLEKLDRDAFEDFIESARAQAAQLLRELSGTDAQAVLHAEQVLTRAREYLDRNVGTGHIAGMIYAELLSSRGINPP